MILHNLTLSKTDALALYALGRYHTINRNTEMSDN